MTTDVQIETERLALREITPKDTDLLVDLFCDSQTMDSYRGALCTSTRYPARSGA